MIELAEVCSYCGESGHRIQQCPKWKTELPTKGLCEFLMERMQKLFEEAKREPEMAKERMASLEETLRRVRDKVFDEQGRLIDKAELNRRKRRILDTHHENLRIWLQRMEEVLVIAEYSHCPNLDAMRKIHDLDAMAILTSVFPKILASLE